MLKLAHIAISVSNIGRSVAFYRKNFGLECKEKYQYKTIGLTIALLKKDGVTLELFEFKKFKGLPQYRKNLDSDLKTLGVKHFCFAVTDIKGAYNRFKRAGVRIATDMRPFDNGLRYFFIKDPDGILLEIMESGRKT